MKLTDFLDRAKRHPDLYRRIVGDVAALQHTRVSCRTCGHTATVDAVDCLRSGWPAHCGQTMTLDSPGDRP